VPKGAAAPAAGKAGEAARVQLSNLQVQNLYSNWCVRLRSRACRLRKEGRARAMSKPNGTCYSYNSAAADQCASAAAPQQRPKVAHASDRQLTRRRRNFHARSIKLASENKITAKNSWSLALIDHLSDLVKAEKDDDTSTNFQKASCTLDAGVKIYASRVDSVHSETFKVLGGLSRSAAPRLDEEDGEGEEGGEDDDEDGEGGGGKERTKGATRRGAAAATLEPAASHTSHALEEAVAVDPLFQKTSAQFDEGGAAGLLMNGLSVHRGCDTVFDSHEVPDFAGVTAPRAAAPLAELALDVRALAPCLAAAQAALAGAAAAGTVLRLTPTLASIRALLPGGATQTSTSSASVSGADAGENSAASAPPSPARDLWADGGMFACAPPAGDVAGAAASAAASFEDDMFSGDADGDGYYGGGGGMDDDDEGGGGGGYGGDENDSSGEAVLAHRSARGGDVAAVAGRIQMGSGGVLQWVAAAAQAAGAQPRRAWAGAAHWRFSAPPGATAAAAGAAPVARKTSAATKRGPFFLDFTAPLKALDMSKFEPPAKASDTRLAGVPTPADTLLPADLRYAPAQLVRLFLKPSAALATAGPRADSGADNGDARRGSDAHGGGAAFDYDDDDDAGGYGGGDGGWDSSGDMDGGAQDGSASAPAPLFAADGSLVAAPRRVEQIRVNYARSAKVVDVRALKAALWTGLQDAPAAAAADETVSFQSLLASVTPACGAGEVADLSVHMCFICVLHLANEHGLEISGVPSLDEMRIVHGVPVSG
jgi:condensin complex subunit 2